jgi:hypothetical protein
MAEDKSDAKISFHNELQKKTFSRWMNYHLSKRNIKVGDLYVDLKDGLVLINLLEILGDKKITYKYHPAPKIQIHELENINLALKWTSLQAIRLVNIGAPDIHQGRPKPTLGLIWALISRFQSGNSDSLLDWVNQQIKPYEDVPLATNFHSSWQDGKVLSALVDSLHKGAIDMSKLGDPLEDVKRAMQKAEELFGIPQLIDAKDLVENPEEKSVQTYISLFKQYIEKAKEMKLEKLRKGKCDPAKSYAEGPGLKHAVTNCKKPAEFTIFSLNEDGVPTVAKNCKVEIIAPDGKTTHAAIKDNEDGTYSVGYSPDQVGNYQITCLLDGVPIKDMTITVAVKEGADASKSTQMHFVLRVDAFFSNGEKKKVGGDRWNVLVGDLKVETVDKRDGTYTAAYTIAAPKGAWPLKARLNGGDIPGTPFVHVASAK